MPNVNFNNVPADELSRGGDEVILKKNRREVNSSGFYTSIIMFPV